MSESQLVLRLDRPRNTAAPEQIDRRATSRRLPLSQSLLRCVGFCDDQILFSGSCRHPVSCACARAGFGWAKLLRDSDSRILMQLPALCMAEWSSYACRLLGILAAHRVAAVASIICWGPVVKRRRQLLPVRLQPNDGCQKWSAMNHWQFAVH